MSFLQKISWYKMSTEDLMKLHRLLSATYLGSFTDFPRILQHHEVEHVVYTRTTTSPSVGNLVVRLE